MSLSTHTPGSVPNYTPTDLSSVLFQGDVPIPASIQRQIVALSDFHFKEANFARTTGQRLALKEASVFRRAEDGKLQARVVHETTVAQDMTDRQHTLHGGCAAFLVDMCPSIGMAFLAMVQGKSDGNARRKDQGSTYDRGLSPSYWGAKLRIVSTSTSFGARTVASQVEIWDVTNRRLCVSGVQNQMAPKLPTPMPTQKQAKL